MKTQQAIGRLNATNTEDLNERTHHNIWVAATENAFYAIAQPPLWEMGILNVCYQTIVKDGRDAAKEFIDKLAAFLLGEGIPELGLKGEITLVTTDDETSNDTTIHRILVRNNQVLYSEATLEWDTYTSAEVAKKV